MVRRAFAGQFTVLVRFSGDFCRAHSVNSRTGTRAVRFLSVIGALLCVMRTICELAWHHQSAAPELPQGLDAPITVRMLVSGAIQGWHTNCTGFGQTLQCPSTAKGGRSP